MFSIVVSSLRVKSSTLRNPTRPHPQPKGVRLIHKSAKSRCTSGGDKPGSNNDLGSLFKFDARKMPIPPKSGSAAASGKKESFDDFFESLMKTNPQSKPSSSALNLDSILSSLNKTVKKDDEAEAAFRTIMKKPTSSGAPEQPKRPVSSAADNMIPSLTSEDDAEFLEFLEKYRDQFQAPKSEDSASKLDFASLKNNIAENPFAGLSAEEVAEKLKEATQQIAESNLPASMRSATSFRTKKEIQEAIEAAQKAEAEELDDALRQMKETDERPIWVTNITESLPDGSKVHSSLLEDYEDKELADASVAAAADANFDEDDPELFQSLLQHDKGINDMEYWSLFPTQVKRWLIYTRTPKGYYDDHGEWQTASLRTRGDFDEEDDDLLLDKSFMEPQEELDQVEDDILDQVDAEGEPLAQSLFDVEREIATEETDMFADSGESVLEKDEDWDYWEAVYHNEQQFLPEDLRGQFRFRIKPSEINDLHPRLRRLFSFKYATPSEIRQYRAQQYISKWGRHPSDTGNSAVQIAILSQRIGHLTKTLKTNVTDTHNGYRLQTLIRRRKGLMKHLKKHDLKTYYTLLKDLAIRDQVELWTSSRK